MESHTTYTPLLNSLKTLKATVGMLSVIRMPVPQLYSPLTTTCLHLLYRTLTLQCHRSLQPHSSAVLLPYTTETPAAVPDGQNVPTHFTGSVYSQLPQPATVDSGFVPPYAMYPQPPTPLMYQQSSSVPAAVYPPGTGPVTNISAPRWMQTNQGAVHIMPTPCVYQSPQATHTGSAVPYNTPT
ncbi:hypothetical protein ANN_12343 [Periplaneta americana]|uniref:DAZ-associated protein 2 n=1 Tax=Periplaneta americana TaxID=6978 RepID=A0ABQ8TGF6_PERAM|nr:hypothetical protein ANN_12343 [Periplaneta americana]